jgi:hypothetical protein
LGAVLASASLAAGAAVTSTVVDFPAPNGTLRYLDVRPDTPYATLIAFAGGQGSMGIQGNGTFTTLQGRCSAVGRNRQVFAEHGYAVVLVDSVASATTPNMLALIDHLRQRADVPVWLVGMSSSTEWVAILAASLPALTPLGAAFLSPIAIDPTLLAIIRRPSLVLINSNDADQSGSQVYAGLTAVPAKRLTKLSGGTSAACGGIGYHVFYGIEAAFVDAITAFVDAYNDTLTAGHAALDLNQHGLTGSWYEPATSGQGLEIEVFANPMSGTGSIFLSWFTYDTVNGGAERQRWYTAQGQAVTGQSSASLTIYQNVGGFFNALPVTHSQAVGTATLSFDTCTSGQLVYNFTDGTGRAGTIPLTRLTQNVTCSSATPHPTDADFALSGNWYAAATSGQGMTVEVNPNSSTVFAAWYTYPPNGTGAGPAEQRWYTAQPTSFAPGMRSIPVTIYETTGGLFDIPTPSGQKSVAVGTGTITFQSCTAATFSYNFAAGTNIGLSGVINLGRVGPVPPGCTS